jgi:hypothetical protein
MYQLFFYGNFQKPFNEKSSECPLRSDKRETTMVFVNEYIGVINKCPGPGKSFAPFLLHAQKKGGGKKRAPPQAPVVAAG